MIKTYNIITFGCAMNRSDSERIAAVLEIAGYEKVKNGQSPDLLVFNACSVRQSAIDRIYGQMGKFAYLKKKNPEFKAIVTGCILPKDKQKFFKGFDLVLNIKDLNKLPILLSGKKASLANKTKIDYFRIKPKYQNKFSALIPISFGCNRFCAYCAVPYTRGLEINRSSKDILKEAKSLIFKGYKEINLLGQTVSSWKDPSKKNYKFVNLLKDIEKIPGKFWVRFNSPYILDFNDELIGFLSKTKKINNYLNLPLQSGDGVILKRMDRKYTVNQYLKVLNNLKRRVKDFSFSIDIIVGFCGETEKQFQNTFKIFKETSPATAYIARYSVRPGTAAQKLFKDSVSLKVKKQRFGRLTGLLRKTAKENNQKEVGRILEVLVDTYLPEKKEYLAKTRNFKAVRFKSDKSFCGKFVNIKITKAREFELLGELKRPIYKTSTL